MGHALQDTLVMNVRKKGGDLNAAIDRLYAEVRASLGLDPMLRVQRRRPLPRCMEIFIVTRIQEEITTIVSSETVAFLDKYLEKPYWITENLKKYEHHRQISTTDKSNTISSNETRKFEYQ